MVAAIQPGSKMASENAENNVAREASGNQRRAHVA
jgi:hypothetical protein